MMQKSNKPTNFGKHAIDLLTKNDKYTTKARELMISKVGDNNWRQILISLYKKIIPYLNNAKIVPIPFYGTLLGIIRDSGIICKDDDLDFLIEYTKYNKMLKLIDTFCLKTKGFVYYTSHGYGLIWPTTITLIEIKTKANADFDFFTKTNNIIYRHVNPVYSKILYNEGNFFPQNTLYPLKRIHFLNGLVRIPKNSIPMLKSLYGDNWNVPYFVCNKTKKNSCSQCHKNEKFIPQYGDTYKMRLKNIQNTK